MKPFKDRGELAVFLISTGIQLAYAFLIYLMWGHVFLTEDAVSHSYIGRLVWIRIENLGTVWLPLFHLLVAPFTLIPFLYTTGLGGSVVNSIAAGLTSLLLYRMLRGRYGLIVSMVFATNILTLSFSTTAMQQSVAILFGVWAIYYLADYLRTASMASILKMGLVLSIGELARYEVWLLAIILMTIFSIRETIQKRHYNIPFIINAFWGIFLWLLWGNAIFHDPLIFLRHYFKIGGELLTSNPLRALENRFDVMYVAISLALAAILIPSRNKLKTSLIILSIYLISLPLQFPYFALGNFPPGPYQTFGYYRASEAKNALSDIVKLTHGTILASTNIGKGSSHYLSVLFNIEPSRIIDEYDKDFALVSLRPWEYVDYVIIPKESEVWSWEMILAEHQYFGHFYVYLYYKDVSWRDQFESRFRVILETHSHILYGRIV